VAAVHRSHNFTQFSIVIRREAGAGWADIGPLDQGRAIRLILLPYVIPADGPGMEKEGKM
jgi:hypothetical protein